VTRLARTPIVAAAVIASLASPAIRAQSDKISLRMAPGPGQTVQMLMTQKVDFEISVEGAPAPVLAPMRMVMQSTMVLTQKTGARQPDGSIDVELTYDQIRSEVTMNDQPTPTSDLGKELVGKPVVLTYNASGEIVGVRGLPAGPGLNDEMFKQMIGSFYGNLPVTALSVGETTTGPLDFNLPLPLPGASALQMTGQTILKLVSVDKNAAGRSARFDSTISGKMASELAAPDGKSQMQFNFTLSGDGTTIMDLDKGLPRSHLLTNTFVGRIDMAPGAPTATSPSMNMRGTMNVVVTSK
jgi:hypothetical protein